LGCELDTDGDGVEDYRDKCPNTPEAAWGKVDTLGCPLDTDGDGVPDYIDECPETPEAAWGKVDEKGCPIDSDGDGVPDYLDACPDTPEAAYGKVDANGCPMDSDKDGVPDYLDQCPNTPEAAAGLVDSVGCPLDSDGDGVPDYIDQCPAVPGIEANKGCPEMKREVRQLLQKAMQGIEFETGKATIKKKSFPLLDKIAEIFIENSNYIIEVQGHTDDVGKAEVNKKISEKRAQAVMKYLEKKGVAAERMSAVGYGPDVPIADNRTKAGRQKNRRVEFKITFEEVHIETVLDHADPGTSNPE
jgi:outer membrane protein OmpA-like peptidoglycan-associated protein